MATVITSECINCGACEPECPNTAIYQGGVQWELNGATHDAISNDIFYIVPDKCTECVGFFDHEACAAVCPVDCCVPDPNIPETEDVLIARAKTLHPETDFPADFPSRFRTNGAAAPAPAAEASTAPSAPAAAAPVAAAPVAAPKPGAAPSAVPAGRVEKPLTAPKQVASAPQPTIRKTFGTEMSIPFEEAYARLSTGGGKASGALKVLALLLQPILGALPPSQKKAIEEAVGNKWVFTSAGATGVNILHNFILYPVIGLVIGALWMDQSVFTQQLNSVIFLGVGIASLEAILRLREAILYAAPADEVVYRGAVYWPPLALLAAPFTALLRRGGVRGSVPVEGFHGGDFEEKTERERRYGEVYTLSERENGYLLCLEFPRRVPKSAQKEELGIPDEMPDYDYDLSLEGDTFIVRGHVVDPNIRKLAGVSPAFPPDFTTSIELKNPVSGFKHRVENKTLEVVLLK